jgi:hypothetical protein
MPSGMRFPPSRAVARLLALAGLLALLGPAPARAASASSAGPVRLGGLLALDAERESRWSWCGAWVLPVGDSCLAGNGHEPPYVVNRGLEYNAKGVPTHQGVDLDNRHAGGVVRAAANGIVVRSVRGSDSGYGAHVVIAHRLEDRSYAYTVYSHLVPRRVTVNAGEMVAAGQSIGRVGRSGRASTEHLHFEVRVPETLDERWEKCRAVDPLEFIATRRACRTDDTTWARPYLEWADRAALLDRDRSVDEPLRRHQWWIMLARAARHSSATLPSEPADLRRMLIEDGVLPESEPESDGRVDWKDAMRDLDRLHQLGLRLPAVKVERRAHRNACEARFRTTSPTRDGDRLARASGGPSIAEACLALADLSTTLNEPPLADQP